jgi:hypothetical protein
MIDAVAIYWRDHYSLAGWHDADAVGPAVHVNISVGIPVLHDTDEFYCTIAQTSHSDNSVYGDILHILKTDIVKIVVLKGEDEDDESFA